MAEATALAERTGIDMPDPASADGRASWAGLFTSYPFATIVLGLMSATGLMLVYSLNTWLPELILRAGFDARGSLSFLMVFNGGAGFGRLGGVGGPVLSGYLAGGGFALETIFYILASLAVLGCLLTTRVRTSSSGYAPAIRRTPREALSR